MSPFFMRNVRLRGMPPLPWFSQFQELNVRTYAFDSSGTAGGWFYSLDCNRAWATFGARILQSLPHLLAEMHAEHTDWIGYSARRRGTSQLARFRYRAAGENRPIASESLEFFLLERYYLFAYRAANGALLCAQVAHAPYHGP